MRKSLILKALLFILLLSSSMSALSACGCVNPLVYSKDHLVRFELSTEPSTTAPVPSQEVLPPSGGTPVSTMPTGTGIPPEPPASCAHSEGEWLLREAPTCTQEGTRVYVCTGCNGILDTESVEATGHTPEHRPGQEATCREPGSTEGTFCAGCNEVLEAPEVLPMLEHVPSDWLEVTPASCTAEGLQVCRCVNCNLELEQQTVAALGHAPRELWTLTQEGTCLAPEVQCLYCTRCEGVIEEVIGDYGPHRYGDWAEDPAPTCDQPGHRSRVCRVCSGVEEEDMPAAGHRIRDAFVPAQGGKKGYFLRTCTECDYSANIPIEPIRARIQMFAYIKYVDSFTDANYRVSASGGYGSYTYKFEAFKNTSATSPTVTRDFSSDNTFLLSASGTFRTLTGFVLQVTIADEAGNRTVYRVLVDDDDTVIEESFE